MTTMNGVTLIISVAALIVSVVAIYLNYKLQIHQSELAKIQSDMLKNQTSKATCLVEIIEGKRSKYEFKISNISQVDARNVDIKFHSEKAQSSIRENKKYKDNFPIKTLSPSQSVSLYTTRDLSSPDNYPVILTWTNPDDSTDYKEITLIP
ncbi:TPA: hypothetical protein I8Z04_002386 [Legionella pneumophila]|nr:hypothetical protein [Legionella pneumophila]